MTHHPSPVRPGPVTVGVDGSDGAVAAVRWAARYAGRLGAPLRLVTAMVMPEWLSPYRTSPFPQHISLRESMRLRAEHALASARDVAVSCAPQIIVDTRIVDGAVADVLEAESHRAQLVVIGVGGSIAGTPLGRNTAKIVNRSRCPVVLHRGSDTDREVGRSSETVVVGVDGSDTADSALIAALGYAETMDMPVTAVYAYQTSMLTLIDMNGGFLDWDKLQASRELWFARHIQPICEKFPHVSVTAVVRDGDATTSILSSARPGDLVVVGSRGRRRLVGAVLGSVSQNLVHHARGPAMVVHCEIP